MVQRLAGSDAGFLFVERPSMTSTCVDVTIIAPAGDGRGPLTVTELRHHIAQRLDEVPSFRWRLEQVPFGANHPVWVEDPDFDLGYHVRHHRLAAPGGDAELDAHMAATLPILLDQRHPLWRVTLVDGLADGRQALVWCFHHSMADGAALITTLDRLFGEDPPAAPSPWDPVPVPGRLRLLADGLGDLLRAWLAIPAMLARTIARFRAVEERRKAAPVPVPKAMGDAPHCVLNLSSSADRVFGRTRLPLADLQRIKSGAAPGTALSDVVLTVVAGALRDYLLARGELPDRPLVVNVPVGNDSPGAPPRQHGNRFANFFSSLATDVADPSQRLAAVTSATAESKHQLEILGRDTLPAWLDRIPPAIARPASRRLARRLESPRGVADFNVLVSNVRVPDGAWNIGSRAMEAIFMSGPVADGAGLNITIVGYRSHLHISIVANPSALDDPSELAGRLQDSLDELSAAVLEECDEGEPAGTTGGAGASPQR